CERQTATRRGAPFSVIVAPRGATHAPTSGFYPVLATRIGLPFASKLGPGPGESRPWISISGTARRVVAPLHAASSRVRSADAPTAVTGTLGAPPRWRITSPRRQPSIDG